MGGQADAHATVATFGLFVCVLVFVCVWHQVCVSACLRISGTGMRAMHIAHYECIMREYMQCTSQHACVLRVAPGYVTIFLWGDAEACSCKCDNSLPLSSNCVAFGGERAVMSSDAHIHNGVASMCVV